ncbi:metal ABC transporter permease [Nocardioides sp.]|uniref:metal ABC transporter permease n=1 Tax=Nocardioides sp. TaxID=35761 RepID=UPI0039E33D31
MTPLVLALDTVGWHDIVNFDNYGELLPIVRNSLIAGAVLGLVGGLISVMVITRDLPFAVHGISELSFAGASGALLLGASVVVGSFVGSLIASLALGVLGMRARDRNSIIGVLMPFGLGLGILFLALYHGRAANKFGLLTGQIVAIDNTSLTVLLVTAAAVSVVLLTIWRPLLFASVDPEVAAARGVPVRFLGPFFVLVLGCTVAISIQVIGALLILTLLVTPAAAALQVTASPVKVPLLAMAFAFVSMVGGILLATGTSIPISPYVTTLSFAIYVVCRVIGRLTPSRR